MLLLLILKRGYDSEANVLHVFYLKLGLTSIKNNQLTSAAFILYNLSIGLPYIVLYGDVTFASHPYCSKQLVFILQSHMNEFKIDLTDYYQTCVKKNLAW